MLLLLPLAVVGVGVMSGARGKEAKRPIGPGPSLEMLSCPVDWRRVYRWNPVTYSMHPSRNQMLMASMRNRFRDMRV